MEGDSLAYGDKNSGYSATKGQTSAKLFASVDGTDCKKLEWSDATYFDSSSNKFMAPIMKPITSTTWGASPYFEIVCSTKDYENIKFSAKVSGSKKGPATYTLQYKTDNPLPTDEPYTYYSDYPLPDDTAGKQKVYIRFVIQQDKRVDGASLFDSISKGNSYINKIVISGDRTSSLKMPYTTKATTYFGENGTIAYKSFDDASVKYSIYTEKGTPIIENAEYNSTDKISLGGLSAFDAQLCNRFRVDVWSENGTQKSMVNSQNYTYKGGTVAEFKYKKSNGASVTAQKSVAATTGNAELSMYPNGTDAAEISYNTNALRAEASAENVWNFDKTRSNPDKDGYWLITASTKGYTDIKFSADQLSTSKGPRDYSISFSTDGINYTPLANSSVHVTDSLSSSYTNIPLPAVLNDRDKIYIKIKIDGGETLSGLELDSTKPTDDVLGKGNTEINNIEICGIKIENKLGIDRNPQTIEKGKTYYINYASKTENPALILAGYNSSGAMVMCKTHTNKIEIPSDSNVTYIKVMLWENFGNLVPVVHVLTKEVE